MDNKTRFSIGYFLFILMFMTLIHSLFFQGARYKRVPYNEFRQLVKLGQVERVELLADRIRGQMQAKDLTGEGKSFETAKVDDPGLIKMLEDGGVIYQGAFAPPWIVQFFTSWILPLGILFSIYALVLKKMGPGQGVMAFGRSKAKIYAQTDVDTRFDDVAGVDEAKEELAEVVDFLKNPERYQRLGGKIPRGVLLVGPPGCGKTLMAKAVAGEAGVNFFSISGSEFVEMFVGLGAARVRDLFEQAMEKAPCIVFIDELDALGKSRGMGGMGGHDEREQTLNQLLVEMDGFDTRRGVIIMAATNRPEILDVALLRPGRFDRQVLVDRPDLIGRKHILKVHTKNLVLNSDVNIDRIGEMTPGLTGADLANLANEAALLAARNNKDAVGMAEFEEAFERVAAGLEKKSRVMTPDERRRVAYHELGHAIVAELVGTADPVQKVSIIPRGLAALGYTLQRPTEDRYLLSKTELEDRITVLMGGRTAEVLVFKEVSTGAQNDLQRATDIAISMVTEYGMTDRFGPRALRSEPRPLFLSGNIQTQPGGPDVISSDTQREVDEEVGKILDAANKHATEILSGRRADMDALSEHLLEHETISGDDLRSALGDAVRDSRVAASRTREL